MSTVAQLWNDYVGLRKLIEGDEDTYATSRAAFYAGVRACLQTITRRKTMVREVDAAQIAAMIDELDQLEKSK